MDNSFLTVPIKHRNPKVIVKLAEQALIDEVLTHPKPGLVTPFYHKTHPDMNFFTFLKSSWSLRPYFKEAYLTGYHFDEQKLTSLMRIMRPIGKQAEQTMFKATQGVNTHKGAIFIFGIVLSGLGYLQRSQKETTLGDLTGVIQKMASGIVADDFSKLKWKKTAELTAGEKQYVDYGYTGIRGQAEAGFPLAVNIGLPALTKTNGSKNETRLLALLAIIAKNRDSNLIKRSGNLALIKKVQGMASDIVNLPEPFGSEGKAQIDSLCRFCGNHNLSLGGSADLLILTIFYAKLTDQS